MTIFGYIGLVLIFLLTVAAAYGVGRYRREDEMFRLKMDNLRLAGKVSSLRFKANNISCGLTGGPVIKPEELEEIPWE